MCLSMDDDGADADDRDPRRHRASSWRFATAEIHGERRRAVPMLGRQIRRSDRDVAVAVARTAVARTVVVPVRD